MLFVCAHNDKKSVLNHLFEHPVLSSSSHLLADQVVDCLLVPSKIWSRLSLITSERDAKTRHLYALLVFHANLHNVKLEVFRLERVGILSFCA
ncbi:hypothetical protein D3C77_397320 [compost metagenome]